MGLTLLEQSSVYLFPPKHCLLAADRSPGVGDPVVSQRDKVPAFSAGTLQSVGAQRAPVARSRAAGSAPWKKGLRGEVRAGSSRPRDEDA